MTLAQQAEADALAMDQFINLSIFSAGDGTYRVKWCQNRYLDDGSSTAVNVTRKFTSREAALAFISEHLVSEYQT